MHGNTPFNFFGEEDKRPTNLLGEAHGNWDIIWNSSKRIRVTGNLVKGRVFGYFIYYQEIDNLITEKHYYAR